MKTVLAERVLLVVYSTVPVKLPFQGELQNCQNVGCVIGRSGGNLNSLQSCCELCLSPLYMYIYKCCANIIRKLNLFLVLPTIYGLNHVPDAVENSLEFQNNTLPHNHTIITY